MRIKDAKVRLNFWILAKHVLAAMQLSKGDCVIARALKANPNIKSVHVGAAVTIVEFNNGEILRYKTPKVLQVGLNNWDKTKNWQLPEGEYYLDVLSPSQTKEAIKARAKTAAKVSSFNQSFYNLKRKHTINPRHIEFLRRKAS